MRILKAPTAATRGERGKTNSVPPQRMKQRQMAQHQSGSQLARRLCMLAAGSAGQPCRNARKHNVSLKLLEPARATPNLNWPGGCACWQQKM